MSKAVNSVRANLEAEVISDMVRLLRLINLRLDIEKKEKGDGYLLSAIHPEIKDILSNVFEKRDVVGLPNIGYLGGKVIKPG